MSGESFLGLDIGGQSIKGIRLGVEGRVLAEASRTTPASGGAAAVLGAVRELVAELVQSCLQGGGPRSEAAVGSRGADFGGRVLAVGVGTPGGVDASGRIVGEAANIPGWVGTALGDEVGKMAGAPCGVRNDGNLAAYAEWAVRAGKSRALLFIGLGTGIGGGFVEDGHLLGGCDDRALEIGHIVIEPAGRPCACGVRGCSEAYAAGPSIGRIAADFALGRDAVTGSLLRGDFPEFSGSGLATLARRGERLNAREVYAAYSAKDPLALAVDDIVAEALARTAATGMAILAPDLVVFGGGVIAGAPHLAAEVARRVPRYVYKDAWADCRFETALLAHRAGLLGAALYGASLVMEKERLLALAKKAL